MTTSNSVNVRPELDRLPPRLQALPVDTRGYPVPWFVAWIDGRPDHRIMDPMKWIRAIRERRCWICGDVLGVWLSFPIGPMCGINRTTAEPPSHTECARWSIRNCPFLSRPHMERREAGLPDDVQLPAGDMLRRNPGVLLLWTTKGYGFFDDGRGGKLIEIGEPHDVAWFCEGRAATRAEVVHSVDTGFPALLQRAEAEPFTRRAAAHRELAGRLQTLQRMYPPA